MVNRMQYAVSVARWLLAVAYAVTGLALGAVDRVVMLVWR